MDYICPGLLGGRCQEGNKHATIVLGETPVRENDTKARKAWRVVSLQYTSDGEGRKVDRSTLGHSTI